MWRSGQILFQLGAGISVSCKMLRDTCTRWWRKPHATARPWLSISLLSGGDGPPGLVVQISNLRHAWRKFAMLKHLTLLMVLLALLTACAPAAPENRPTGAPENRATATPWLSISLLSGGDGPPGLVAQISDLRHGW